MAIRLVGDSEYRNNSSVEDQIKAYLSQIEQLANDPNNLAEITALEGKISNLIGMLPKGPERDSLESELAILRTFIGQDASFFETDYNEEGDPIDTKRDLRLIDTLIDGEFAQTLSHNTDPKETIYNELSLMQAMVDDLKNCDATIDADRIALETKMIQAIRTAVLNQLPQLDPVLAAKINDLLTDPYHGFPFYFSDVDYFTIDGLINQIKDYLKPGSVPTPEPLPEKQPQSGSRIEDKIKYDLWEIQQIANSGGSSAEVQKLIGDIQNLISRIPNKTERDMLTGYLANLKQFANNFGDAQPNISKKDAVLIEWIIEGQFDSILTNADQTTALSTIPLELNMMQAILDDIKNCDPVKDKSRIAGLMKMFNEYSSEVYAQSNQLEPDTAADIQEKLTDPDDGIPYFFGTGQFDVLDGFIHQLKAEVAIAKLK